jgi:hypothetical protein
MVELLPFLGPIRKQRSKTWDLAIEKLPFTLLKVQQSILLLGIPFHFMMPYILSFVRLHELAMGQSCWSASLLFR